MKNRIFLALILSAIVVMGFSLAGATNFDRLVLGSSNYGEDPNTTADITGQNDEYLSNYTDGEWNLGSASLNVGTAICGTNVFATTAETDTVTISGVTTDDIFVVSPQYTAGVDQQDVLEWEAITGKLVVHRLASGESALKYSYIRLK